MKTLVILLFGLASSLLPLKCAKAENIKDLKQNVEEKISQYLYYTSNAELMHGKMVIEFTIDSAGKIIIASEQTTSEELKNFIHEKFGEITFEHPESLKGERFVIRIKTEE